MYFSFGLLLKKLLLRKHPNTNNYQLCGALFNSIDPQYGKVGIGATNKYQKCKTELPELITIAASIRTSFDIAIDVEKEVIPLLEPSSEKVLILALKEELENDTSIDNSAKIGDSTKYDLLHESHFVFSVFLASLLILAVCRSNRKGGDDISQVSKDLSFSEKELDSIVIVPFNGSIGSIYTLPPSLNAENFNKVFKELSTQQRYLKNIQSSAKFFYLPTETFQFDYTGLVRYLKGIAMNYVFSRSKINKSREDNEEFSLCVSDAFSILTQNKHESSLLGQMLIYAFIESVLKAPKIMSPVEQNQFYSEKDIKWEGVYLLHLPNESSGKRYQLVFGSSTLEDNLQEAVNKAISKLTSYIPTENKKVRGILDTSSLRIPYDDNLKRFLNSVLNPSYKNPQTQVRAKSTYGIFIGYSLKIERTLFSDEETYQVAVEDEMKANIKKIIPFIDRKLAQDNILAKSSVNFYFVPFNSVLDDAPIIISDMLRN